MTNTIAFAADIGGTTVKLGLFSAAGELLEKWEIPTRTEEKGRNILPDVAASISEKMQQKGLSAEQVIGVGVDVPGPVNGNGIVKMCVNLGWDIVNVQEELAKLLPGISNVVVGNDANVAALGEALYGAGKGCENAVMFTLGTGVGGGVIVGGQILNGANGAAGEVGHFPVEPNETTPCNCGKCGCLEQYASATGIVRLARRMMAVCSTASPLRGLDDFSARTICNLAGDGDELSLQIVDRCGQYLGRAMALAACVSDPDLFIVGGGMSRAGDVLLEPTRRHYRRFAFHASADTPIVQAALGNDAGICGCAAMVLGKI